MIIMIKNKETSDLRERRKKEKNHHSWTDIHETIKKTPFPKGHEEKEVCTEETR